VTVAYINFRSHSTSYEIRLFDKNEIALELQLAFNSNDEPSLIVPFSEYISN